MIDHLMDNPASLQNQTTICCIFLIMFLSFLFLSVFLPLHFSPTKSPFEWHHSSCLSCNSTLNLVYVNSGRIVVINKLELYGVMSKVIGRVLLVLVISRRPTDAIDWPTKGPHCVGGHIDTDTDTQTHIVAAEMTSAARRCY